MNKTAGTTNTRTSTSVYITREGNKWATVTNGIAIVTSEDKEFCRRQGIIFLASFGHGGWLKVENEQGALMEAVRVEIDPSEETAA